MSATIIYGVLGAMLMTPPAEHRPVHVTWATTTYHRQEISGTGVFYREAGPKDAPTIVLLHGFPSSSRMFERLIPALAERYHVIAPDYPGFGESDAPAPSHYAYTFDHLADTMASLLSQLGVRRYSLFMQDYGGPVGFRMALMNPHGIGAMIVQNANVYREGLGPKWSELAKYWVAHERNADKADAFLSPEATKQRHLGMSPNADRYDPQEWAAESALLARPGQRAIQRELLYDYRNNVASYPRWQEWLRQHQPRLLVLWGAFDPSFVVPGAEAYRRDVPQAEVHILEAGHFALDEAADDVARLTVDFLDRANKDAS